MPFRKPHQTANITCIDYDSQHPAIVIPPKGLNIIWGNDHRYWNTQNDSAELIQVSWLEVSGKVNVKQGKKYSVKFHVAVKENGFGWDNTPVLVMAKIGKKGSYEYKEVKLVGNKSQEIPGDDNKLEITVGNTADDLELHFGLYEVWSGKWKGGLIINKAVVKMVN